MTPQELEAAIGRLAKLANREPELGLDHTWMMWRADDAAALRIVLAMAKAAQQMAGALAEVEWVTRNAGENMVCPWCGDQFPRFSDQTVHSASCPRERALTAYREAIK